VNVKVTMLGSLDYNKVSA